MRFTGTPTITQNQRSSIPNGSQKKTKGTVIRWRTFHSVCFKIHSDRDKFPILIFITRRWTSQLYRTALWTDADKTRSYSNFTQLQAIANIANNDSNEVRQQAIHPITTRRYVAEDGNVELSQRSDSSPSPSDNGPVRFLNESK